MGRRRRTVARAVEALAALDGFHDGLGAGEDGVHLKVPQLTEHGEGLELIGKGEGELTVVSKGKRDEGRRTSWVCLLSGSW